MENIGEYYSQRMTYCSANINKYSGLINTYSFLRLICIAVGFVLIYQALAIHSIILTFMAFFSTIIVFAWLVRQHSSLHLRRDYFEDLLKVNQNEVDIINTGSNMYANGDEWADEKHLYSSDLDIFGSNSLFHLLNRSATGIGNRKLSAWLLSPSTIEVINKRQEGLQELAAKRQLTQDVQAALLIHNQNDDGLKRLFVYLNMPSLFSDKGVLKRYVAIAPIVFVITAVLAFFYAPFLLVFIALGIFHAALISFNLSKINKTDRLISRVGQILESFSTVFSQVEREDWKSEQCKQLKRKIASPGNTLSDDVKQLSAIINRLDYRLNQFLAIVLNYVFVWDLKQVFAAEMWKEKNRNNLEAAFDVIAELEALISLTSVHRNNPRWAFPSVLISHDYTLAAVQLAHPLIKEDIRVGNSFNLIDDRKIEIITGSNMAGKSTFLRTIGINAVLAFAGAPVCAEKLEISLMKLITYMRIKDSLNESTSTFKAELDRLQMILNVSESGEKAYFLIDEMLRGTNSVDKYRGSKAIIEKLIRANSAGMIATHDIQLAQLEYQFPNSVRNYHFDIQVDGSEMMFDYKIKEGECKTFNASLLLKRIGVEA